jgi:CRISPR-associated protein Csd1
MPSLEEGGSKGPLVSFDKPAFTSYGKEQGGNAPVSEEAAFKYGAALNWLLNRSNGRTFRLGETTVVFWAEDRSDEAAIAAEDALRLEMTDEPVPAESSEPASGDDAEVEERSDQNDVVVEEEQDDRDVDRDTSAAMQAQATHVRDLRRAPDASKLDPDARLHVLGISPNAGRVAVRFWVVETWGHLAVNIARFKEDMRIEPSEYGRDKKAYALLFETAVQGKPENIHPRLGGELARAILTGSDYPQTLFAAVLGRIRADKRINASRAGLCRAFIVRNFGRKDFPVALDIESNDEAYNLGRLFATYEYAERSVADRNATIKDKFIGAASATPRRVFPILMRGYEHNASALAKGKGSKRGAGIKAAKAVSQILGRFEGEMPFSTALRLDAQGRFFVGYYHQMQALYTKAGSADTEHNDAEDTEP